jgi:hypothetical protein
MEHISTFLEKYTKRVWVLETEGMTTSDAQAVADVEFLKAEKKDIFEVRSLPDDDLPF